MRAWAGVVWMVGSLGCRASTPAVDAPDVSAAPSGGEVVQIVCGSLIDGVGAVPRGESTLRIVGDRIERVIAGRVIDPEHEMLDLGAYTCLPGLIDMHTHLMDRPEDNADLSVYFTMTEDHVLAQGRDFARATLHAGFTTVRNLGTYYGWASRTLRDEIDAGATPGPRMQIAGFYLTVPGGGGDLLLPDIPESRVPAHLRMGVARGPDAFRDAARRAVEGGADVLKVIASGAVLSHGGVPGAPEMTEEEIEAVVGVAREAGIRVAAHAHGAESIVQAIRAGVNTIEHASLIDDLGLRLAREQGVALSMDIYDGDYIDTEGRRQGWPEEFLRKNRETTDAQRRGFRAAHEAGVTIVYGTDAFVYPHGNNAKQFVYMVEHGMSEMEAIQSATSVAARVLGREQDIGALEAGRFADLIAVDADPLADITVLERVAVVIKGGDIVVAPGSAQR